MSRRDRAETRRGDRTRAEREVDEELAYHRDRTVAALTAGGLSAADAEREALRRLGSIPRHRRALVALELARLSRKRRRAMVDMFTRSARAVARGLRRGPGFTLGVVAILTLGLGVNAITFGLVDRLILSGPAGVERPDELRRVVAYLQNQAGATVATTELA